MGVKCRENRPQVFLEVHSEGTSCSTHQTEEKTSSPGGGQTSEQRLREEHTRTWAVRSAFAAGPALCGGCTRYYRSCLSSDFILFLKFKRSHQGAVPHMVQLWDTGGLNFCKFPWQRDPHPGTWCLLLSSHWGLKVGFKVPFDVKSLNTISWDPCSAPHASWATLPHM